MAFTVSAVAAKDSAGAAIGGGLLAADIAGSGVGPFFMYHGLVDGVAGVNRAAIDSSNRLTVLASIASGGVASGAVASGAIASGAFASGSIAVGAIAAGATSIADNEDASSGDGDRGIKIFCVRKATPVNTSGSDGDYEFPQMSVGRLWTNTLLGDGTNAVTVKAASTAAAATDPSLVVALSPNGLKVTEKWIAGATAGWASAFGSEVNSIISGNAIQSSVVVTNGTGLDTFCDVSFSLGSITTSGSPYLGLYLYPLLQDGSIYGDNRFGSSAAGPPPSNYQIGTAGLPVGTQVLYGDFQLPGRRCPIIIPPGSFVFVLYNATGATLAASANTIKYRTYNRTVT